MNELWNKYFAGVRWPELILAVAVAVLGKLQMDVQGGKSIDQHAIMEALSVGASVGWAYLRMPKNPDPEAQSETILHSGGTISNSGGEGELPPGVDDTGPKDDVHADAVTKVISSVLPPALSAVAPDLAGNITKELGRVLKRGIRW